ncbi:MAG: efflux RND transporter permease subunit [Bacteroidales bacterium]|nr:efflux RND transporter permease subunit [Bacteroidales bacterium]
MSITELSIKRPSFIIVIFLALIIGGILSFQRLGYEILPRFTPQILTISTLYPGAAPNEVESQITKKIEDRLSNQSGIVAINSSSFESLSMVTIELATNAKLDVVSRMLLPS